MSKQSIRGPISALLLITFSWASLQARTTTIVQPPGASCILNENVSGFKATLRPPKFRLDANNSIQMTNTPATQQQQQQSKQTDESSSGKRQQQFGATATNQVAFETICDGWENSVSPESRAFWLFDKSRRALIAKFVYQDKASQFEHPEARLFSPIFPSIPLYHSMEDSKYYGSCKLRFKIYSTIASQIDVALAPIPTVVAGSAQLASPLTSPPTILNSYPIDTGLSNKNRQLAEKNGESIVWVQQEITMPIGSKPVSAPHPYRIEFSSLPTKVTSGQALTSPNYLVGIALSNITLTPECFGLHIDDYELARMSAFEQQELQLNGQKQPSQLISIEYLDRLIYEHRLLLFLFAIGALALVMVYCTFDGILRRSRMKNSNNRQRVYATTATSATVATAVDRHLREEQMMQKHNLHPISLSLIENVELRSNPNYASLAHENDNQLEYHDHHLIGSGVRYEPDEWEVAINKVILRNQIGTGAFGMVFLGELISDDGTSIKRCAIKTLPTTATFKQRMDFLREASIMKQFNTFHVVKLLGMVSTTNPVYVIMEYMQNGDLKSYLRRLREVHQREEKTLVDGIYLMAAQIADGMAYLASKRFVHRDLAARNCMVGESGVVKVGDFGLTRDIYDNEYYRRDTHGRLPVRWMAPESLLDNIYTSASDVWAYGIVVWEIVTFSAYPYQGLSNEEVIHRVCAGFNMSRPDHCPNKLYTMMNCCWLREPQERPSFCDLVQQLLPETEGQLYPNCFYRSRTLMSLPDVVDETALLARSEPDNSSRAESYPMISDDRKPLVALYPVVH